MEMEESLKKAWKVVFLLILVALLLGVLTWTGIMKCSTIPGWCDVYYGAIRFAQGGKPSVAIVHGEDGLGQPEILAEILADPRVLGVHPVMIQLEFLELGNIKNYDLVIVERARTIETKKLDIFTDYVLKHGGRLVWTGDAGTKLAQDDRLLYFEQRQNTVICEDLMRKEKLSEKDIEQLNFSCIFQKDANIIGPWARVRGDDTMLNFDQFLGVNYFGNFCELTTATADQAANCFAQKRIIGKLIPEPTGTHPLIIGLRPDLGMYGDFAIVEETGSSFSTRALSVKFDGKISVIQQGKKRDLGNVLPMIQTSQLGERVAYYALPPEQFALPPMNYISIPENMYVGMIQG